MLKHFGHGLGGSEAAEALLGSLAGSMATLGLEPLLQSLKLMALTAQQERGFWVGQVGENVSRIRKKSTGKKWLFVGM